jgi:predicted nuclease of predicted toxin-antitoxin system
MLKLYANENFPLDTVQFLRNLGYDILTTHEIGKSNLRIPDEDVLTFAISEKRAILTINRKDFIRLHRLNSTPSGIIVCTKNDDFENFRACIHAALLPYGDNISNLLLRVYKPSL